MRGRRAGHRYFCHPGIRRFFANTLEIVLGTIAIILILEGVRRSVSIILSILGLMFILYPMLVSYMPGFLYGQAISYRRIINIMYLYPEGIYGSILQMMSSLLIIFLIFGALLAATGAGKFFVDLAMAAVGRFRGGPAKVGVLASSLFGMINGSSMANAATCGVITIPMMKSIGYNSTFAAAVEAVASNGGQIMPPVMGLAAFLMVDFLKVPYRTVMLAGFIPGILYFLSVLFMVDFEAAKVGLKGMPREQLPSLRKTLRSGWYYMVPLAVLLVMITAFQYSAQTACMWSIISMLVLSFLVKGMRMGFQKWVDALAQGVRPVADIGCVVALSGILTAALAVTGVDVRMTGGMLGLAGGNLFVLLLMTAIIAMILGLALPTTATYLLCAMLLVPALVKLGMIPIAAHFFVLYYGVSALITPPVCTVAFITASIAGAPFMKTGWESMRLGIVTFILPFVFPYAPELLLIGSPVSIAVAAVLATIGVLLIAGAMEGYFLARATWPVRGVLLLGGILLIAPGWAAHLAGIAMLFLALFWQVVAARVTARRELAAGATDGAKDP